MHGHSCYELRTSYLTYFFVLFFILEVEKLTEEQIEGKNAFLF